MTRRMLLPATHLPSEMFVKEPQFADRKELIRTGAGTVDFCPGFHQIPIEAPVSWDTTCIKLALATLQLKLLHHRPFILRTYVRTLEECTWTIQAFSRHYWQTAGPFPDSRLLSIIYGEKQSQNIVPWQYSCLYLFSVLEITFPNRINTVGNNQLNENLIVGRKYFVLSFLKACWRQLSYEISLLQLKTPAGAQREGIHRRVESWTNSMGLPMDFSCLTNMLYTEILTVFQRSD